MKQLFLSLLAVSMAVSIVSAQPEAPKPIRPDNADLLAEINYVQLEDALNDAAFSPDGTLVATVGEDTAMRLWNTGDLSPLSVSFEHYSFVKSVLFFGEQMATASWDRSAILWSLDDPSEPRNEQQISGFGSVVDELAISPDGERLAFGVGDGSVRVVDLASGEVQLTLSVDALQVTAVAFSPDGLQIAGAAGFPAQEARIWDALTGELLFSLPQSSTVTSLAYTPDGVLAVGGDDGMVSLWRDGAAIASVDQTEWIVDMAFSPDGMLLAVARQDGIMVLWDVSDPQQVALVVAIAADAEALTSLSFSADGGLIATTSESGALRLWGVPRGLAP